MITGSWVRERRGAMPRLLPRRLRSLHTLAIVLVLALIVWVGWLWYRSSSFVKVEHVTVAGLSGPNVSQIREALTSSAMGMTTLNMNVAELDSAVQRYAYVKSLTVTRHGAHDISIDVIEQVPVALVDIGSDQQVVDADGRLLPDTTITHGALPLVPISSPPAGTTITETGARAAIAVLATAPYALLAHIQNATSSSVHGVIVQLRNGPQLYFGPSSQLHQKWQAAVAVLQNHDSAGATYIDVSDPQRPAAGAGVSAREGAALGLAGTATTAGGTTSPGP